MKASAYTLAARALWVSVILFIVAACGGGVGSGGTGAVAGGVVQGTVTGFGSVIVDGTRIDDRSAPASAELSPGVFTPAGVDLGDRVEIAYRDAGVADSLRVEATLRGAATSGATAGRFTALGQTIVVNGDAVSGPVTQFGGGYTGAASIVAGDSIEVHGVFVAEGAGTVIQATRVDKLATAPTYLKVAGRVASLGAAGPGTFRLNGLAVDASGAGVVVGGSLADGQFVAVLARPASLSVGGGVPHVTAAQVRIRSLDDAGAGATLSGRIDSLDSSAQRFEIDDVVVDYTNATLPAGAALAEGQYVQVRGVLASAGRLTAASILRRDGQSGAEAELKGNIIGLDVQALTFHMRGVAVDASAATLSNCGNTLTEGAYAEVQGTLSATGVVARTVKCEGEPAGATIERKGVVGSVNASGSSFVLGGSQSGDVTVHWTDTTYFNDVTAATLAGKKVEVEGVLTNGILEARKVSLDD